MSAGEIPPHGDLALLAADRAWRAAEDASPDRVALAARHLLTETTMPASERRTMRDELAAAEPGDLPLLLCAWHSTALLWQIQGSNPSRPEPDETKERT